MIPLRPTELVRLQARAALADAKPSLEGLASHRGDACVDLLVGAAEGVPPEQRALAARAVLAVLADAGDASAEQLLGRVAVQLSSDPEAVAPFARALAARPESRALAEAALQAPPALAATCLRTAFQIVAEGIGGPAGAALLKAADRTYDRGAARLFLAAAGREEGVPELGDLAGLASDYETRDLAGAALRNGFLKEPVHRFALGLALLARSREGHLGAVEGCAPSDAWKLGDGGPPTARILLEQAGLSAEDVLRAARSGDSLKGHFTPEQSAGVPARRRWEAVKAELQARAEGVRDLIRKAPHHEWEQVSDGEYRALRKELEDHADPCVREAARRTADAMGLLGRDALLEQILPQAIMDSGGDPDRAAAGVAYGALRAGRRQVGKRTMARLLDDLADKAASPGLRAVARALAGTLPLKDGEYPTKAEQARSKALEIAAQGRLPAEPLEALRTALRAAASDDSRRETLTPYLEAMARECQDQAGRAGLRLAAAHDEALEAGLKALSRSWDEFAMAAVAAPNAPDREQARALFRHWSSTRPSATVTQALQADSPAGYSQAARELARGAGSPAAQRRAELAATALQGRDEAGGIRALAALNDPDPLVRELVDFGGTSAAAARAALLELHSVGGALTGTREQVLARAGLHLEKGDSLAEVVRRLGRLHLLDVADGDRDAVRGVMHALDAGLPASEPQAFLASAQAVEYAPAAKLRLLDGYAALRRDAAVSALVAVAHDLPETAHEVAETLASGADVWRRGLDLVARPRPHPAGSVQGLRTFFEGLARQHPGDARIAQALSANSESLYRETAAALAEPVAPILASATKEQRVGMILGGDILVSQTLWESKVPGSAVWTSRGPDGLIYVGAVSSSRMHAIDPQDGRIVRTLALPRSFEKAEFRPDGRLVVTCSNGSAYGDWNTQVVQYEPGSAEVTPLAQLKGDHCPLVITAEGTAVLLDGEGILHGYPASGEPWALPAWAGGYDGRLSLRDGSVVAERWCELVTVEVDRHGLFRKPAKVVERLDLPGPAQYASLHGDLAMSAVSGTLTALRVDDGSQAWQVPVSPDYIGNMAETRDGGLVFLDKGKGGLTCLDAATGRTRWRRPLDPKTYPHEPYVADDGLIFFSRCVTGGGYEMLCLDPKTGATIFTSPIGDTLWAQPVKTERGYVLVDFGGHAREITLRLNEPAAPSAAAEGSPEIVVQDGAVTIGGIRLPVQG